MIFWIGSLLLITSLLAMVSDEVGVAKERFIMVASTLFFGGCNIGGAVAIIFGILLMVVDLASYGKDGFTSNWDWCLSYSWFISGCIAESSR